MESLIVQIGARLRERGETLAVAESCTGGYLAHCISLVPGASDFFLGAVVAYDNSVKTTLLGVSPDALRRHGAVSTEVVTQMALGICRSLGAQYGLATSGIAGPGGGSAEKPVGTLMLAIAHPGGVWVDQAFFPGGRQPFKEAAVASILKQLSRIVSHK